MSAETWGSLAKAQDDPETIEECINRLIDAHNEAETSHQGTGQSLESHKNSDEIDHKDFSLIKKTIERGLFSRFNVSIPILDINAFYIDAHDKELFVTGAWISTDSVSGDDAYVYANNSVPLYAQFYKSPKLEVTMMFTSDEDQLFVFGMGDNGVHNMGPYVGFTFSGGHLFARIAKANGLTIEYVEITGIDIKHWHTYVVEYEQGVGAKFYIDDNLVATINNTDLDYLGGSPFFTKLSCYSNTFSKAVYIKPFTFIQDD